MAGKKIYVMTTVDLQFQHDAHQVFRFDFITSVSLTDVVILAVLAFQVATCEENDSRSLPTSERILFSYVWPETAHFGPKARFAHAQFACSPIDRAVLGANIAL